MKYLIIWSMLLSISFSSVYGQTPCGGDLVTWNSSTVPGYVLPTDTSYGKGFNIGSGNSVFLTTAPNANTTIVSNTPSGTPEPITITTNFRTNIGSSGQVWFLLGTCGSQPQSTSQVQAGMSSAISSPTSFLVYPTVSTGVFTVTGSSTNLANADMLVVDEAGRTVYHLHNGGATTVNLYLNNLENGLYFLRVNNGTGFIKIQKIIIMK